MFIRLRHFQSYKISVAGRWLLFFLIASTNLKQSNFAKAQAPLPGKWPTPDVAPPTKKSWTNLINKSEIAKAPIRASPDAACPATDTFCDWTCTGCTRENSDFTKCPEQKVWGLTFDDGPTLNTIPLLDYLDANNIKATFFVVGSRVIKYPDILKRAVDSGHEIGIHTWSHPALTTQTNAQIIAEIKWTEKAIKAAVGLTPKLMRPPYGDIDDRVRNIMTALGYKIAIWDRDTFDWLSFDDPTFQMDWVTGNVTKWVNEPSPNGHISLEHDLEQETAEQGKKVAEILQNAGWDIQPISVCVNIDPYKEKEKVEVIGSMQAAETSDNATDSSNLTSSNSKSSKPNNTTSKNQVSAVSNVSNAKNIANTTSSKNDAKKSIANEKFSSLNPLVFFIFLCGVISSFIFQL
ncbi:hypothetical protein G9A89_010629 [Geosiphon pyriformis]|nr:hypothetical protein G9A89_010629 [Geosiphon pyriformis]